MQPPEEAQPTAERVADDADPGRRAGEREQAVRVGGGRDLAPEHAGPDPGGGGVGVEVHALEARGRDQDGSVERAQGAGAVPGRLRRDP